MIRLSLSFILVLAPNALACAAPAAPPEAGGPPSCDGPPVLAALGVSPSFAVVLTDYSSTAIALLDENGELIDERWVHSGTTAPGLVATLTGDVVLPTRQAGDGTLTLIDRFRTDVLTRFCAPGGQLFGQVRTHGDAATTGYSSNPQDVVFLSAHDAWITRYEPALDPAAPDEDRGNDLVQIDPAWMTRTSARVDLSWLDVTVRANDEDVRVYARPKQVVRVAGDRLVVGLDRLSIDFSAFGAGAVALVMPGAGSAEAVELPGLASCGRVVPVPGDPTRVLVDCGGYSHPYDPVRTPETSGLVLLASDSEPPSVAELRVAGAPALDGALSNAISVGGTRALAVVTRGDDGPDALVLLDLADGSVETVLESDEAFVLGVAALDESSGLVLVPDASVGIRRLTPDGARYVELDPVPIGVASGLPPRIVGALP
jgi:hypothetical protein